jgi:hypothetical protein
MHSQKKKNLKYQPSVSHLAHANKNTMRYRSNKTKSTKRELALVETAGWEAESRWKSYASSKVECIQKKLQNAK